MMRSDRDVCVPVVCSWRCWQATMHLGVNDAHKEVWVWGAVRVQSIAWEGVCQACVEDVYGAL